MFRFLSFLLFPWSITFWIFTFKYRLQRILYSGYFLFLLLEFTLIFNFSIEGVVNIIGLWFLLADPIKMKVSELSAKRITKLVFVYITLGIAVSMIVKSQVDMRYGLFAGEPNFGGLTVIFLFMVYRIMKGKFGGFDYIFLLLSTSLFLYVSTSRTFLLMVFFSIILYILKDRKLILVLIISLSYFLFLNLNFFFTWSESAGIIFKSGYLDDYTRLIYLSDPSSIERIKILQDYTVFMSNNTSALFLGFNNQEFVFNSHNSYIQVIQRNGIIFLFIQLMWMLAQKDLWKYMIFLVYGLFLHNVLSIPYLLMLKVLHRDD